MLRSEGRGKAGWPELAPGGGRRSGVEGAEAVSAADATDACMGGGGCACAGASFSWRECGGAGAGADMALSSAGERMGRMGMRGAGRREAVLGWEVYS